MKYRGKKYKRKVNNSIGTSCCLCDISICGNDQSLKCNKKDAKKGNNGYYREVK